MFLTCNFMKIAQDIEAQKTLIEILTKTNTVYTHKRYKTLEKEEELFLYISNVLSTPVGRLIELYYEDTIPIRRISKERNQLYQENIKVAYGPLYVHFFEKPPIENTLGILAGDKTSLKLRGIFNRLVKDHLQRTLPLLKPIFILIEKRQKEIRSIPDFSDVAETIIEDISDPYIEWAWMKGVYLEESDEFKKFVEGPSRGRLKVLAIRFKDRIYYLYSEGKIFTKEADRSSVTAIRNEIIWFFDIMKQLCNYKALEM